MNSGLLRAPPMGWSTTSWCQLIDTSMIIYGYIDRYITGYIYQIYHWYICHIWHKLHLTSKPPPFLPSVPPRPAQPQLLPARPTFADAKPWLHQLGVVHPIEPGGLFKTSNQRDLECCHMLYKNGDNIWVNFITTSLRPSPGIMVSKGNHPQMALIQVSEFL